jgi:flagellar basal-body rod protein FlgC
MKNTPSIFAISESGMSLERARAEAAALNLANAHVASRPGETAFTPMHAVAQPVLPFSGLLRSGEMPDASAFAPQVALVPVNTPERRVHEPDHPFADGNGIVSYPGVDPAVEMVTLLDATRAYEANVAAMNMTRTMQRKALDIGGNS